MTTTETRMTMIFNEWADRYAKNPEEFGEILGEDGKPVADYGESCMRYFCKIAAEMDEAGRLPTPPSLDDAYVAASGHTDPQSVALWCDSNETASAATERLRPSPAIRKNKEKESAEDESPDLS